MLDNIPPFPFLMAEIMVLFLGIGLHEYAHCKFADLAGDPTPRFYGRVTLNLFKHFEPAGTIMMILTSLAGFGIGWGRPAPADPRKMRNPRWDFFVSVAAGPVSNIAQAVVYAILLRMTITTGWLSPIGDTDFGQFLANWMFLGVAINLALAFFNLIPFGPLDGHWLLGLLLPEKARIKWFQINRQIGMPGLFLAVILLQSQHISLTAGPVSFFFKLLTGVPY